MAWSFQRCYKVYKRTLDGPDFLKNSLELHPVSLGTENNGQER